MSLEFKNKTFQKVIRGYSPEEVEDYLDYIDGEHAKVQRQAFENGKRLALALKKLDETTRQFEALKKSTEKIRGAEREVILAAEEKARVIVADAQAEADRILKRANDAVDGILKQNEADLAEAKAAEAGVRRAADDIYGEICNFRDTVYGLYQNHIEMIEDLAKRADEFYDNTGTAQPEKSEEVAGADGYSDAEVQIEDAAVLEEYPEYEEPCEDDSDFAKSEDFGDSEDFAGEADGFDFEAETDVHGFDGFFGEPDGFKTIDGDDLLYAADDIEEEESVPVNEFADLDDFFTKDTEDNGMSLTDEFDIIFSSSDSSKNVNEIRRQPTIGAEEVPKHSWFDIKKQK